MVNATARGSPFFPYGLFCSGQVDHGQPVVSTIVRGLQVLTVSIEIDDIQRFFPQKTPANRFISGASLD